MIPADFYLIYHHGFFKPIKIFYSGKREWCWAIQTPEGLRYFDNAERCMEYAVKHGFIRERDKDSMITTGRRIEAYTWRRLHNSIHEANPWIRAGSLEELKRKMR